METENTNLVDPIGKVKRMKNIRRLSGFILMVCILRMVISSIWFELIHFIVSLLFTLIGLIAVRTKHNILLPIFGFASIIQSSFAMFLLTYAAMNFGMPLAYLFFLVTVVVLIGMSGFASFKLKYGVLDYEKYHGAYPRCCNKCKITVTPNQNTSNNNTTTTTTEQTSQEQTNQQQTSVNSNLNDFVMIPMQNMEQMPSNFQNIPMVYAFSPQQLVPQTQIQPTQFIQQPQIVQQPQIMQQPQLIQQQFLPQQQFIPLQQFIPQQQINQQPQFLQQSQQNNNQQNNQSFVYRI